MLPMHPMDGECRACRYMREGRGDRLECHRHAPVLEDGEAAWPPVPTLEVCGDFELDPQRVKS
jgi:hypothetical protein